MLATLRCTAAGTAVRRHMAQASRASHHRSFPPRYEYIQDTVVQDLLHRVRDLEMRMQEQEQQQQQEEESDE